MRRMSFISPDAEWPTLHLNGADYATPPAVEREVLRLQRQLETALDELKVRTLERDVAQAEAATLERLRDHAIEELKLCRNWRPQ
jgi:hypothetical protein